MQHMIWKSGCWDLPYGSFDWRKHCLASTLAGKHVSGQVLRSGTAPMAHHGEAQAAESRKDFIHKMRIALKELRETDRWLNLVQRAELIVNPTLLDPLIKETDELIRIFVASIRTAEANND